VKVKLVLIGDWTQKAVKVRNSKENSLNRPEPVRIGDRK